MRSIAGIRLIADPTQVEVIGWDWSRCRSPARARRRQRRGHPQRIRAITRALPTIHVLQPDGIPQAFIAHPDVLAQIERVLAAKASELRANRDRLLYDAGLR